MAETPDEFLKRTGGGDAAATSETPDDFLKRTGAATEEQKPLATAAAPAPQGPAAAAGTIGDFLGAVGHGLSFGLDRPFDAATNWLAGKIGLTGYQQLQDYGAKREQQFATEHPLAQGVGEAIGATPIFTGGIGVLERVLPSIAGAGVGAKVWNALMTGTRSGIASGTAAGGLAEGDLEDRARAAAIGAGVGVAVPAGFGAIKTVLNNTVAPIMARLSGTAAESQATGKIAQALARDRMTPAEVQAELTRLGPNATLADVGGANVRSLGETVASKPGAGSELAESFLEGRHAEAPSRINAAVTAATGSTGDFHAALGTLAQERATNAAPLYDSAFSRIVTTPQEAARVQRFIADPIGQDALQRGMRVIELEKLAANQPFNPADYGVTKGADGKFVLGDGVPTLRLMDAVKRGYDEIVEGFRDSTTGKLVLNQYGRAVNGVRAAYVSDLRDMFPRYGSALDAWGGPSQAMDALSMGRRALSNDPEVTAATIARMSPSDKEFFKSGVARALKDKIDSAPDDADVTRRLFGNQLIRDKIRAGFGDPAAFDEFQQTMEREAQFAKTRREVLKGSQTARRRAGQADVDADIITPAALAAHGNILAAGANVAQQGYNALSQSAAGPRLEAIGRRLFTPGAVDNEYLAALTRRQSPRVGPTVQNLLTMEASRRATAK